jgi:hypothetical protein
MGDIILGPVGAAIMVIGGIGGILCFIVWLTISAFMVRWWWAPVVLFVPLGNIVFPVLHWKVAKKPVLTALMLFGIMFGMFILRAILGEAY